MNFVSWYIKDLDKTMIIWVMVSGITTTIFGIVNQNQTHTLHQKEQQMFHHNHKNHHSHERFNINLTLEIWQFQ